MGPSLSLTVDENSEHIVDHGCYKSSQPEFCVFTKQTFEQSFYFLPFSNQVAFIYVFNLIIGVGALTMPKAFSNAGWLIATVLTGVLCFMRLVVHSLQ